MPYEATLLLCFVKLHMLLFPILIGILNLECAVHPPGNIDAAIPDMVVAMAINPLERTLARRALYRNILLVPPVEFGYFDLNIRKNIKVTSARWLLM
jgi:hypothetical protein